MEFGVFTESKVHGAAEITPPPPSNFDCSTLFSGSGQGQSGDVGILRLVLFYVVIGLVK